MKNNSSLRILFLLIGIIFGVILGANWYRLPVGKLKNVFPGDKINSILYLIDKQYVDTVDTKNLVETAIPEILKGLDPHSVYIPAEYFQDVSNELEGHFSGIGVQFTIQNDTINVVSVIGGGPSEKVGIQTGDRIVEVNDTVFVGSEITNEKVMRKLRGPKKSIVKVGIKRNSSEKLLTFEITRDDIPVNSVEAAYPVSEGIGYIRIRQFGRTTYQEFMEAIIRLSQKEKCNKLIIDLRENSGGYLETAIAMVNEFLSSGETIVYTQGKAYKKEGVSADGFGSCQKMPVIVLTDEFSASASEIFAGAIQDNDRGLIIGRRTFGKGLVQQQIELADGSAIRLTVARYYTPSGRSIQKPYENGSGNSYEMDIINRYKNGEFDSQDSIKLDQSLIYTTRLGRTVYGGGGIMPDIFVPRDTIGYMSYFHSLINEGIIYQFAFQYTDKHRETFSKIKDYKKLLSYLERNPYLFEELISFAEKKGIKRRPVLINTSEAIIKNQLYAYIIRNQFGDEGFYPVFLRRDKTIARAIEEMNSGEDFPPGAPF
ncbi:MAG: S41 family peptidase [Candidatus Azobacteroides sp.]|nr:S41 family peptidase [Candidatus Azobacteroides sp.]